MGLHIKDLKKLPKINKMSYSEMEYNAILFSKALEREQKKLTLKKIYPIKNNK